MKTPIVQDDPEEQPTNEEAVEGTEAKQPTNFAARMGRWSARHRKIAIFGWLGLIVFAVIVRGVLLPASMMLLGDRNWYLPSWLEWLPRLEHEDTVEKRKPPKLPPVPAPTG